MMSRMLDDISNPKNRSSAARFARQFMAPLLAGEDAPHGTLLDSGFTDEDAFHDDDNDDDASNSDDDNNVENDDNDSKVASKRKRSTTKSGDKRAKHDITNDGSDNNDDGSDDDEPSNGGDGENSDEILAQLSTLLDDTGDDGDGDGTEQLSRGSSTSKDLSVRVLEIIGELDSKQAAAREEAHTKLLTYFRDGPFPSSSTSSSSSTNNSDNGAVQDALTLPSANPLYSVFWEPWAKRVKYDPAHSLRTLCEVKDTKEDMDQLRGTPIILSTSCPAIIIAPISLSC
jgi:hypothetical protein